MRHRLFDCLIPLIPILAVAGAMPLTIAQLVLAVSVVGWATLRRAPADWRAGAVHWWPVLLLLAWALASAGWAMDGADAANLWVRVVVMGMLGILALTALQAPSPYPAYASRAYFIAYGGSVLVLASAVLPHAGAIGLLSQWFHGDVERYLYKTVNRGLCALAVLVWPTMGLLCRRGQRPWAWVALAVTALPVMMMDSISAKLGLVIGGLCFIASRTLPARLMRAVVIIVPVLVLAVPYLMQLPLTPQDRQHFNTLSSGRLPIWAAMAEKSAEKPWQGWGMGASATVPFTAEALATMKLKTAPMHPHLSFLQVKLELGLVGLLLAALSIGFVLRRLLQLNLHRTDAALVLATAAAYLAAGLSSFGIWQQWWVATAWLAAMLWARFLRAPRVA